MSFGKNTTKIHGLQKYWEVFSKNIEKFSAKILKGVLQKCLEVFCKNVEKCSSKILRIVL